MWNKLRAPSLFKAASTTSLYRRSINTKISKFIRSRGLVAPLVLFTAGAGTYYYQDEPTRRQLRVTLQGVNRLIRSVITGAIVTLDYKITLHDVTDESAGYTERLNAVHKRAAERILWCCLKNGGLYIKFGQGLVIMNHILPRPYLETLVVLQDKVLTRGPHEVETLFREEFGKLPSEVFREFDEEPIAAASLAQVHKAVTHTGDEVAVKVQYIDLQDRFLGDMFTMRILAVLLGKVYPKLDFADILKELKGNMARELDFVAEATNAEKCARDLSHLPYVYVPKVHWNLTTKKILTTEFIHGVKISNKQALAEAGLSLHDIDNKLVRCFADQIFHSGHVHADPHPGNLYVRKDKQGKAELVLLDHGLYEYMEATERIALANMFKAIVLKDEEAMRLHAHTMNVDEWHLLACCLTQKYVATKSNPPPDWRKIKNKSDWKKLSEQEKKEIRDYFEDLHSRMLDVMKQMPKPLMLIMRNLNTIRSIHRDHGNLVNRYIIMARSAVEGAEKSTRQGHGLLSIARSYKERFMFEYHLKLDSIRSWLLVKALTVLVWLGRVPNFEETLNRNSPQDIELKTLN